MTIDQDDAAIAAMEQIIVEDLLSRRRGDCTEDESAWIKGYFDRHDPVTTLSGARLANHFLLEHDEWEDEVKAQLR